MAAPIITLDVERAAGRRDRRLVIPSDAVISPDARDLAAKLGVSIVTDTGSSVTSPAPDPVAPPSQSEPPAAPLTAPAIPRTFVPPITSIALAQPVPVASSRGTIPVRNVPIPDNTQKNEAPRRPGLPLGIVLGKTVRSTDIEAAKRAGYMLVRHAETAYVTRAARHAAEIAMIRLFADPDLPIAGRPPGPGTVLNPLESGGAITRSGAGIVPNGGLPIGDDQIEGSLTER
jgi:hypothetical protein